MPSRESAVSRAPALSLVSDRRSVPGPASASPAGLNRPASDRHKNSPGTAPDIRRLPPPEYAVAISPKPSHTTLAQPIAVAPHVRKAAARRSWHTPPADRFPIALLRHEGGREHRVYQILLQGDRDQRLQKRGDALRVGDAPMPATGSRERRSRLRC